MKFRNLTFVVLAAGLSMGNTTCELATSGSSLPPEPQTYSLDGTKFISPSITDGNDPRAMLQSQYEISTSGRLLLRFESLSSKESSISLADGRKVYIEVSLRPAQDANNARAALELCPITKNWMMLATWNRAHFMPGGSWAQDGGDYDAAGCIRSTIVAETATTPAILRYDVTQWLVDYVRGRHVNYGMMLTSNGATVLVRGDADGSYSPRINWLKQP